MIHNHYYKMPLIDLVILNYNGRKHLEHLLPTAVAEVDRYGIGCRVVVVDNQSTVPDTAWIRENFPTVEIWLAPKNEFLFSYNSYAEQTAADILILLNNDLKLLPNFIAPLVRHFDQDDVFAVSATSRDWDDCEFTFGPIALSCHRGNYYWMPEFGRQETIHTLFASGGFMAVDRKKFLELGGFHRLFHPAYCEDLDLCFRAWSRGWRCIFEPASIALHREHGSWNGGAASRADRLMLRGKLLFQWSSLPRQEGLIMSCFYGMHQAFNQARDGQWWRLSTSLRTWLTWRSVRKRHHTTKVTLAELKAIRERMGRPLLSGAESDSVVPNVGT